MDRLERLAYWKQLIGNTSSTPWTDEADHLYAYFESFRPDGEGVEKVFEGVERGSEVLPRLLSAFHHTREGAHQDLYFVVRKPQATTRSELLKIMTEHLEKVRLIALAIDYPELATLEKSVQIEIVHGAAPPHSSPPESNFAMIWDGVGDWFHNLEPIASEVSLLHEAFYSMACSYDLARFVMWPIYREATPIEDPFAPAFQLWIRGADYRFKSDSLLTIYAPEIIE